MQTVSYIIVASVNIQLYVQLQCKLMIHDNEPELIDWTQDSVSLVDVSMDCTSAKVISSDCVVSDSSICQHRHSLISSW